LNEAPFSPPKPFRLLLAISIQVKEKPCTHSSFEFYWRKTALPRRVSRYVRSARNKAVVLSAENGEQALRLCEREVPDLAILDLIMPKLGGPATALTLRDRFPNVHILFTSGYSVRRCCFANTWLALLAETV
jgi:chemotaxis response regulator CheB